MSNININQAFEALSILYDVPIENLKDVLNNAFEIKDLKPEKGKQMNTKNIILPFCGVINERNCKAIIYNHGLYTQCTKETNNEICKGCCKLKYGRIEERLKSKPGEFITPEGKKEIPYEKFISKMGYNYDDVNRELKLYNLSYDLKEIKNNQEKKGRGRPKKVEKQQDNDEEKEEIDVIKITVNGNMYFKTKENILLNIYDYEIVGVLKNGNIEHYY